MMQHPSEVCKLYDLNLASDNKEKVVNEICGEIALKKIESLVINQNRCKTPLDKREVAQENLTTMNKGFVPLSERPMKCNLCLPHRGSNEVKELVP